ncbi:MAG: glycosyltransferase [Acutalibacteraceae bacterium]|nr:glycosyltransferase [Acutalibacteraceae bacterium]
MYELVTKGCDSLSVFLEENRYDAIICTHVFSAMMVTELRRRRKLSLPCYFVATDYTCSPGVNQTSMDAYFIPHEKLIPEFAENGIQTSKLVPSGIPVRDAFYHKAEKKEARRTLSLPEDKKTVLLMCGSMGCGPIKSLAEELPEHLSPNATLIVICGSNVKLFKLLTKKQPPENCRIIGFTNKMPLYMDAADLILTKPGGLSTSEAAVKALPMLFINAVPGCETRNIEFFLNNGCADMRDSDIELCDAVCEYLENPDKLDSISKTMAEEFSGNATECIYKYVLKDVERAYGRL